MFIFGDVDALLRQPDRFRRALSSVFNYLIAKKWVYRVPEITPDSLHRFIPQTMIRIDVSPALVPPAVGRAASEHDNNPDPVTEPPTTLWATQ